MQPVPRDRLAGAFQIARRVQESHAALLHLRRGGVYFLADMIGVYVYFLPIVLLEPPQVILSDTVIIEVRRYIADPQLPVLDWRHLPGDGPLRIVSRHDAIE